MTNTAKTKIDAVKAAVWGSAAYKQLRALEACYYMTRAIETQGPYKALAKMGLVELLRDSEQRMRVVGVKITAKGRAEMDIHNPTLRETL